MAPGGDRRPPRHGPPPPAQSRYPARSLGRFRSPSRRVPSHEPAPQVPVAAGEDDAPGSTSELVTDLVARHARGHPLAVDSQPDRFGFVDPHTVRPFPPPDQRDTG